MEILLVPILVFGALVLLLAWWNPTKRAKKLQTPKQDRRLTADELEDVGKQ